MVSLLLTARLLQDNYAIHYATPSEILMVAIPDQRGVPGEDVSLTENSTLPRREHLLLVCRP
ncbi:hypothetical protein SSAG_00943 [Streptomyces sp. Mg1]|nr:hypothetical protein SSAG_00943 [Streptomyces sp. Mg1]